MKEKGQIKSISQMLKILGSVMAFRCQNQCDNKLIKSKISECYNDWTKLTTSNTFLNWGLYDKNLLKEF